MLFARNPQNKKDRHSFSAPVVTKHRPRAGTDPSLVLAQRVKTKAPHWTTTLRNELYKSHPAQNRHCFVYVVYV